MITMLINLNDFLSTVKVGDNPEQFSSELNFELLAERLNKDRSILGVSMNTTMVAFKNYVEQNANGPGRWQLNPFGYFYESPQFPGMLIWESELNHKLRTTKRHDITNCLETGVLMVGKLKEELADFLADAGMPIHVDSSLINLRNFLMTQYTKQHKHIIFSVENKRLEWKPIPGTEGLLEAGYLPSSPNGFNPNPYSAVSNDQLAEMLDHYALTQVKRLSPEMAIANLPQGMDLLDLIKERLMGSTVNQRQPRQNGNVEYPPGFPRDWAFGMYPGGFKEYRPEPILVQTRHEGTPLVQTVHFAKDIEPGDVLLNLLRTVEAFGLPPTMASKMIKEIKETFTGKGLPEKFNQASIFMTYAIDRSHPVYEICSKADSTWGIAFSVGSTGEMTGLMTKTEAYLSISFNADKGLLEKWLEHKGINDAGNFVGVIVNEYDDEKARLMLKHIKSALEASKYLFIEETKHIIALAEIQNLPFYYHDKIKVATPYYSGWSIWTAEEDPKARTLVLHE